MIKEKPATGASSCTSTVMRNCVCLGHVGQTQSAGSGDKLIADGCVREIAAGLRAPGRLADIVPLDWHAVTYPCRNQALPLLDVLLRRAQPCVIETVMIGGRTGDHEGAFTGIDRIACALRWDDTAAGADIRALASDPIGPAEEFHRG